MADVATALFTRLSSDTEIAAVVVSGGKKRIYPTIVPQKTPRPYIRYQTISDPRPEDLDDYTTSRVVRFQLDCFADTYLAARDLAERVINATSSPATVDGVVFGRTKAEGPRDLGEDVAGTWIHRASLDLLVEFRLV
jgi:hypothetical protein